jgi:hypothetical protein
MPEDQKPKTEENVEEPEAAEVIEEPDPGPPPAQDYGSIVYVKRSDDSDLTEEEMEKIRDADIVIEDREVQIIVKNRNGVVGVVATPDLIDQAEVIG